LAPIDYSSFPIPFNFPQISNHQKDGATSREGGGNDNAAAAAGQSLSKSDPIEIVDEFGCSAWPGILPQIQYAGDLLAKMEVQTFALDFDQVLHSVSIVNHH
jgi:hypothetical protein